MSIDIPDFDLRLLAELGNAQGAGLTAAQLGSILAPSDTHLRASISGAQHALNRLRQSGFVTLEATKPVHQYRITPVGLRAVALEAEEHFGTEPETGIAGSTAV